MDYFRAYKESSLSLEYARTDTETQTEEETALFIKADYILRLIRRIGNRQVKLIKDNETGGSKIRNKTEREEITKIKTHSD